MISSLILAVCLAIGADAKDPEELLPLPDPTPEIVVLVEQLGGNKYLVRKNADKKLRELGWPALRAVQLARHSIDPEIRTRATEIYESYLRFSLAELDPSAILTTSFYIPFVGNFGEKKSFPSIWYLDNELRYPEGLTIEKYDAYAVCKIVKDKDIAKNYYLEVGKIVDKLEDVPPWKDSGLTEMATCFYIRDSLLAGKERRVIFETLQKMVQNHKDMAHYEQTDDDWTAIKDWQKWANSNENVPGPLLNKSERKFPPNPEQPPPMPTED